MEFAVVLPVFLTMVWGMIEFGHAFMTMHVLNAAANSAARVGMTEYASTGDVVQRAEQILESAIDVGNVTIDVKDASVFDQPGMDPASVNYDALPAAVRRLHLGPLRRGRHHGTEMADGTQSGRPVRDAARIGDIMTINAHP